jgi:hypothetical protein
MNTIDNCDEKNKEDIKKMIELLKENLALWKE